MPSGIEKPRIEDSSSVRRSFSSKTVIVCGPDCMQPHTRRFSAQNVSSIGRTCENVNKPIIPFPSAVTTGNYGSPSLYTRAMSYPSFWFGDTDGRVRQSCCRPVRHEMMWPKISANDGKAERLYMCRRRTLMFGNTSYKIIRTCPASSSNFREIAKNMDFVNIDPSRLLISKSTHVFRM